MPPHERLCRRGPPAVRLVAGTLLFVAAAGALRAQNGNQMFRLTTSYQGGFTRIGFPDTPSHYWSSLHSLTAALAYSRYTDRSFTPVTGWFSTSFLRNVRLFNFGLTGSHYQEISPRARLSFGGGYSSGFNFSELIANGVFTLENDLASSYASTSFDYDLSDKTRASGNFNFNWFRYNLTGNIDGSQFVTAFPLDDDVLSPQLPGALPTPDSTPASSLDASVLALNIIATEGLRFRDFSSYNYRVRGTITHDFSSRTGSVFSFTHRWLDLEPPELGGGTDAAFRARATHEISNRTSFGGQYELRRNTTSRPHITSHTGLGDLRYRWTRRVTVTGAFGVTYFSVDGPTESRLALVGGAGISANYTRSNVRIDYSHRFDQSLGFGRNLNTDLLSGSFQHLITNRTRFSLYGGLRHSRDSFIEVFSFISALFGTNLSYALSPQMMLGVSYLYQRIDRDVFDYRTHLITGIFSYGFRWR